MRVARSAVGAILLAAMMGLSGALRVGAAGTSASSVRIFVQTNPSGPAAVDEPVALSAFAFGSTGPSTTRVVLALPHGAPRWETLTAGSAPGTATFAARRAGVYTVDSAALGQTRAVRLAVYGQAAAVILAPDWATLAADGASTDGVAVTVVDAYGTTVTGFDGSVVLSDRLGLLCPDGQGAASETVVLDQGQGTAQLCAPGAPLPAADRIGAAALMRAGYPAPHPLSAIRYGRAVVTTVRPVLSALTLLPVSAGDRIRVANKGGRAALGPTYVAPGGSVSLTLSSLDQGGSPLGADLTARVRLAGPASLSPSGPETSETLRFAGEAPVVVYTHRGRAGSVTVRASVVGAPGVSAATYSVQALPDRGSARLRVLVSRAIDDANVPYNLYDVMVLGPDGQPAPAARGVLEVSDDSAAVATTDPLARLWGRTTSSLLFASPADAPFDADYAPLAPGGFLAVPIVDGSAAFAVVTGAAGSAPPHLTLVAPALRVRLQPGYVWSPGQPAMAILSAQAQSRRAACGLGACALGAAPGQPVTLSAQVTDAHGNALAEAGLPVLFALRGTGGSFAHAGGRAVWALTDARGVASATLLAPAAGSAPVVVTAAFNQHVSAGGLLTVRTAVAP